MHSGLFRLKPFRLLGKIMLVENVASIIPQGKYYNPQKTEGENLSNISSINTVSFEPVAGPKDFKVVTNTKVCLTKGRASPKDFGLK